MMRWPQVEAVTHAREALEQLRANGWVSALATNAADSDVTDIRAALARVGLDQLIDRVYCSRAVGHTKPSCEFFAFIAKDLGLSIAELVMVGDSYDNDILGANAVGIRGLWPLLATGRRIWISIAVALPFIGIPLLAVTHLAGRSAVMAAGPIVSVLMLRTPGYKRLGYVSSRTLCFLPVTSRRPVLESWQSESVWRSATL